MGPNMHILNRIAMVVGYVVISLSMLGVIGIGDFYMRYGPADFDQTKHYNCQSGDSFWTRKQYACGFAEWSRQQAETKAP